jgi:VWFA-related protein
MSRSWLAVAAAVVVAGTDHGKLTAQTGKPSPDPQSYTSAATAILVDVVVRDRKGRLVTDLSAADFEVAEDGLLQSVDTFTRVTRGGGIGVGIAWKAPNTTIAAPPASSTTEPRDGVSAAAADDSTTAIVFDHLSAESLRLAQKATLDYVPMSGESSVSIGVFATDPGIRVVQRYTTDRGLVRRAVERVLPAGTSAEEQKMDRADELLARRNDLQAQSDSSQVNGGNTTGAAPARTAAQLGERENELRLIQTEINMIRSFENLDREHRGYDTALALLSVVQSMAYLSGRKTIVFFSEGLPVTPALAARLDVVIDAANRANVTTYAVDANGLRAKSTLANMRKEMQAFADERRHQNATGVVRTDRPLTMAFERVEDTFRLDSRTGLGRLAEDTGGFLFEASNDLTSALRRIDEDNRFHYLLTYSPKNTAFDGRFRAIQVKVHRPGTQVFARKGYRAIRRLPAVDAGGYETPALALLDRTPLPNAFPVHAAGFSFPDPSRPGLTPVLVRVGTDAFRFDIDPQRSTYAAQVSIVVRIRDQHGNEVQKVSQQYLLAGEAKDLGAAKNGEILFYREPDLPPGVYTMESIVFDAVAGHGSARVATLTVPAAERSALGMSSLILVNKVEQVSDAPAAGSSVAAPLYVGRTLVYPNLGEPIRKSAGGELPFYFTLYGNVQAVSAFAQLLRNGDALAEAPVHLPFATGLRVQHVGRLPIDALPAGTYELRIRATDGRHEVSRATFFTLRD